MSPVPVDIDRRAIAEARKAWRWFVSRSSSTADRFQAEIDRAIVEIGLDPKRWPRYLYGTRYFRIRKFRHIVVFLEMPPAVKVIAVAHTSRRPGYWRRRLP